MGSFAFANSADLKNVSEKSENLKLVNTSFVKLDALLVKSCTYDVYNSTTFQKIGQITVTDVPGMLPCDDPQLMADISAYISQ